MRAALRQHSRPGRNSHAPDEAVPHRIFRSPSRCTRQANGGQSAQDKIGRVPHRHIPGSELMRRGPGANSTLYPGDTRHPGARSPPRTAEHRPHPSDLGYEGHNLSEACWHRYQQQLAFGPGAKCNWAVRQRRSDWALHCHRTASHRQRRSRHTDSPYRSSRTERNGLQRVSAAPCTHSPRICPERGVPVQRSHVGRSAIER